MSTALEDAAGAAFAAIDAGAEVVLLVVTPEVRKQMLDSEYNDEGLEARAKIAHLSAQHAGVSFRVEVDRSIPEPGWRLVVS